MMTNKERKERQKIRKELIEEGILPPPKKRINRKKYAEEMMDWWRSGDANGWDIIPVFSNFLPNLERGSITDEEMTALRILHMAKAQKEFHARVKAEGRSKYKMSEWYEEVYRKVYPDAAPLSLELREAGSE